MTDTTTDNTEIKRSFPVSGLARLTLQSVEGQVDLAVGDEGVISVRAFKHAGPGADQTEIEIAQDPDGRVIVITHYREDLVSRLFHSWSHGPVRVDYTVRLPKNCQLEVAVVSAAVQVQGLAGQLALRSVSGPLALSQLSGRLSINTVSGPVAGDELRLAEALQLENVSGDVVLSDSTVPAIIANTVSGQVRLQSVLGAGPYDFRSVSGDVWLEMPSATPCRVIVQSLSGRLRADWPGTHQRTGAGWSQTTFGEGGPDINFRSVSGDLHLQSAEGPGATQPAASSEDRLAVLDRLARGELSVDEAVHTLKQ